MNANHAHKLSINIDRHFHTVYHTDPSLIKYLADTDHFHTSDIFTVTTHAHIPNKTLIK